MGMKKNEVRVTDDSEESASKTSMYSVVLFAKRRLIRQGQD